jgi:RimJ/RimL family protein N-acetyltransferase
VEDDGLRLEPAIAGDVEPTYRLQCLPETRAFARNPEAPSLDGHTAWFHGTLANGARELFMIFWQDEIAGFIRVDRLETLAGGNDSYEISIATDPAYWGRGFASKALHYLFDLFPRDVFIAHVLPGNERSHALFRRCGFIWRDGRYERAPRRETGSGRMTTESR